MSGTLGGEIGAPQKVGKAGVGAETVEKRIRFQDDRSADGSFLKNFFEPFEGLIVFSGSGVDLRRPEG